jgi:RIO-like serine/threonine protein kinase
VTGRILIFSAAGFFPIKENPLPGIQKTMPLVNVKEGTSTYSTKTGSRLHAESIMFRRFDHPTIPVFILLRGDVLLMSAVVGKPIENIVVRFSELQDNQKTNIYTALLQGLHHIHAMFVVHGNINLQTIYLQD